MKKYIYRNRHSWEFHSFVRHLMIDKFVLVNETEWHWEYGDGDDGIVRAFSKHFERGKIHSSLDDLYPAALKVAEEEIEKQKDQLNECIARPANDPYFVLYHPSRYRDGHIDAFKQRVQIAIDEAMRIRYMFTIGPIMSSPFRTAIKVK